MYEVVTAEDLRFIPEWDAKTRVIVASYNVVFDESGKKDRSHIIYAGFLFHPSTWEEFSRRWRLLLYPHGISFLHTKDAFAFAEEWKQFRGKSEKRDELLRALADLANDFPKEAHASRIATDGFQKLPHQLRARYQNDPFYVAFEHGIRAAIEHADVLPEDNFNLICDDSEENAPECLRVFRRFKKNHPDLAKRIGVIAFGDDEKLPALQMADMWAACLRKEAEGAEDGIWRELLHIFSPPNNPDITTRPVIIGRGDESRWTLFKRKFRLLVRDAKRLFSR